MDDFIVKNNKLHQKITDTIYQKDNIIKQLQHELIQKHEKCHKTELLLRKQLHKQYQQIILSEKEKQQFIQENIKNNETLQLLYEKNIRLLEENCKMKQVLHKTLYDIKYIYRQRGPNMDNSYKFKINKSPNRRYNIYDYSKKNNKLSIIRN